jgi:hypothetical protein
MGDGSWSAGLDAGWADHRLAFAPVPTADVVVSEQFLSVSVVQVNLNHESVATYALITQVWSTVERVDREPGPGPTYLLTSPAPVLTADGPSFPAPRTVTDSMTSPVEPATPSLIAPVSYADAHKPAAGREDPVSARSLRLDPVTPRVVSEPASVAHVDTNLDPVAAREGGRVVLPAAPVFSTAPLTAFAVLPGSALGAAMTETVHLGGVVFFPRSAISVDGSGQGTASPPADGPAGNATPGEERTGEPVPQPPAGLNLLPLPGQAAALLEGGLPVDLPVLSQDVQEFIHRVGTLGMAGGGAPASARFGPWVLLLSGVAFEFARRWKRSRRLRYGLVSQTNPDSAATDELILGPTAFLPDDER